MSDEKLIVTKSKLDALATSISTKSGVATPMTIAQMKMAVDGIPSGGNFYQDEDGYLVLSDSGEDNIVDMYNNYIYNGAIPKIVNLTGTKIRSNLFEDSRTIEEVYAPNVTEIKNTHHNGGSIFGNCFYGCTNLKIASFPKLTAVGDGMFRGCSNLETLDLSSNKGLAYNNIFFGCSKISVFVFNKLTNAQNLGTNVFAWCSTLQAVDLGSTGTFKFNGQTIFNNDSNLTTLILRVTSLTALSYTNCFNGTPFASGGTGGTLYVPSALISSYQSATNWSTILSYTNNQILPIEGSIYETQYADGTPISS